jgi:hypothetical protein
MLLTAPADEEEVVSSNPAERTAERSMRLEASRALSAEERSLKSAPAKV